MFPVLAESLSRLSYNMSTFVHKNDSEEDEQGHEESRKKRTGRQMRGKRTRSKKMRRR